MTRSGTLSVARQARTRCLMPRSALAAEVVSSSLVGVGMDSDAKSGDFPDNDRRRHSDTVLRRDRPRGRGMQLAEDVELLLHLHGLAGLPVGAHEDHPGGLRERVLLGGASQ